MSCVIVVQHSRLDFKNMHSTAHITVTEIENCDRAPVVRVLVDPNSFYSIAMIDSSMRILWYVTDIHGNELNKGYDTYKSYSGRTLYPLDVPHTLNEGSILLIDNKTVSPRVRRYDSINPSDILITEPFLCQKKETDEMFSPLWYAHFKSLSYSSEYL